MLVKQKLRRGEGVVSMPDMSRAERLFGAASMGRMSLARSGMKLCNLDGNAYVIYDPRHDSTCIQCVTTPGIILVF